MFFCCLSFTAVSAKFVQKRRKSVYDNVWEITNNILAFSRTLTTENRQTDRQSGSESTNHSVRTWNFDPTRQNVLFSKSAAVLKKGQRFLLRRGKAAILMICMWRHGGHVGGQEQWERFCCSRNDCGNNNKIVRHVHFRACYTWQWFVKLVSQQNCKTSC